MNVNRMAVSATIHCLTGCAIGEVIGLILGAHFGLSNFWTAVISISLAFVTGYSLSSWPLIKSGMTVGTVLKLVLLADTLSILAMEITDTGTVFAIPGAMNAGLNEWLFWASMAISLIAAFVIAYPVNLALLKRGQGHALTHHH